MLASIFRLNFHIEVFGFWHRALYPEHIQT